VLLSTHPPLHHRSPLIGRAGFAARHQTPEPYLARFGRTIMAGFGNDSCLNPAPPHPHP
jgi:hypothetical protein